MLATMSSPIVQYTLARIAEFRPIAYTVDVTLISACDVALDPNAAPKYRWNAINRVCAAMDAVAAK
jgi:hypothetical protein